MPRPALGETWASWAARTVGAAGSAGEGLSIAGVLRVGLGIASGYTRKGAIRANLRVAPFFIAPPFRSTAPPPSGPPAFVTRRDTASARLPRARAPRARQFEVAHSY